MKIVVTGAAGRLGSFVVSDLASAGHEVIAVDRRPAREPNEIPIRMVDLLDSGAVREIMAGVDAVCHLGNLPGFHGKTSYAEGFSNNVTSTYNVFEAACESGVSTIINASSVQVYGTFSTRNLHQYFVAPHYLPLDESHPFLPCDAYPLSKTTGEAVAEMFSRRFGHITIFSMRFTSILMPKSAARWLDEQGTKPNLGGSMRTYVRVEDSARAVRLACETRLPGHTGLNISAPVTALPWTNEYLVLTYGQLPVFKTALGPTDPLIAYELAERTIGFRAVLGPLGEPIQSFQKA